MKRLSTFQQNKKLNHWLKDFLTKFLTHETVETSEELPPDFF